jgi:diguanylate cyclase
LTELRRLQEVERAQARTDHLTGLQNRRALEEVVQREMAHADRHGLGLSLALFDIDHFKHVNDRYGHNAGDRILEIMGQVLRASVRQGDLPVRWGGEEFLVFMPATPLQGARSLAERVRARMEAETAERGPVTVTVSAGIAERRAAEAFSDLFSRTDDLLYAAKAAGRNRVAEPA